MRRGIGILAAGASRRLGQPKQLVTLHGEPLLRHVAGVAQAVGCEGVAVVLGSGADQVGAVVDDLGCELLVNPDWALGMATSIHTAVRWAQLRDLDALMFVVCDQVRLTPAHLLQLWAAWRAHPQLAACSTYAGALGIPAVFPRTLYPALLSLRGERGAAKLLQVAEVTQVDWPDGVFDLDTPEDLSHLVSEP